MEQSRNPFVLQPQDYERIKAKYAKFNEPWSPGEVDEKSVPWKEDDECRLLEEYNAGDSFEQMAERRGRTVGAVISRLVKLHVRILAEPSVNA